ncbi:MAG: dihydroneopterin aldolase [Actinomycetales bacterium]
MADTGEVSTVSDRILLRGLRGRGRHGVLPAERDLGQVFIADVALQLDLRAAGRSDDLADTVDYGALAASVVARIEGEPVALLERLAQEIADICLAFPLVALVTVELHKPAAPISVPFDDVTVTITRGR